ncbi:unnamed protein product, partial [Protopolystoma xenopodis]
TRPSELGALLLNGPFTVWREESRLKSCQRHVFLFENALLLTKLRTSPLPIPTPLSTSSITGTTTTTFAAIASINSLTSNNITLGSGTLGSVPIALPAGGTVNNFGVPMITASQPNFLTAVQASPPFQNHGNASSYSNTSLSSELYFVPPRTFHHSLSTKQTNGEERDAGGTVEILCDHRPTRQLLSARALLMSQTASALGSDVSSTCGPFYEVKEELPVSYEPLSLTTIVFVRSYGRMVECII